MAHAASIALVLHPRRDPGPVLDAIGAWATSHGSRLLMREQDAARWEGETTVVSSEELAEQADGVVEARLAVGGQRMGRYRCDGLVISTSIGSTAYAYSPGGPVVSPALDGTVLRQMEPGETIDVRLAPSCGQVVRLDSDRHQRRNQVKLSLLDLPLMPDELRELAAPGTLPGPQRALEP